MVEIKPNCFCEAKDVQCVVVPLVAQKDRLIDIFLEEEPKSFDQASSYYRENYEKFQKEIDSLSIGCSDCPHHSKSLALLD